MNFTSDEVDATTGILKELSALDKVKYGSSYSNIFMHNSGLHTNATHITTGALLCCPLYHANNWHALLATTMNDEPNRVIANSNSFYWEGKNGAFALQNKRHRIYDRLVYTYHRIRNYPRDRHVVVAHDDECLVVANAFTSINSGHDLSIILDMVAYYRAHPSITKIIILKAAHWIPNNYTLLRMLLGVEGCKKLFELEWNKVYRFANIHIPRQQIINITKHANLCEELRQHIMRESAELAVQPALGQQLQSKGARVVLLKTHRDRNVISVNNQLVCENLLQRLEQSGWIVINPEKSNIIWVCATLLQAETIVFSYGSIVYTHMIFFNPKAKLKWIAVGKDRLTPAYNYVLSRNPETIHVTSRDLDSNPSITTDVFNRLVSSLPAAPAAPAAPKQIVAATPPAAPPVTKQIIVTVSPTITKAPPLVIKNPSVAAMRKAAQALRNKNAPIPWISGMTTNSGLLQEHFFVHAVLEVIGMSETMVPKIPFVAGVNHRDATCMVQLNPTNGQSITRTFPVIFPMKRVNAIKERWVPQQDQRKYNYFYRGLLDGAATQATPAAPRKQWVKQFNGQPDNYIEHNLRGRGKDKYVMDTQYYQLMCNSRFVLCPMDVFNWSYRLLEAILCRCIPVLHVGDANDKHVKESGFKVYTTAETPHVWHEEWVEENLKKLLQVHTFSDPNHPFCKLVEGLR